MSTSSSARREPPQRNPLTRDRVLEAALGLIDREGLPGLSMRKLGAELEVEAMSLYNHVAGKTDVLDGIVSVLWGEVETQLAADGAADWRQQARALAAAVRRVAHAHPHAYPLVLTRGVLPDEVRRVGRQLLHALQEAGFGEHATDVMLTLASHATAQALAEVTWQGDGAAAGTVGSPPVVDAGDQLPQLDRGSPFALGLELLIEALDARLAGGGPAPA